jgi:hypothetical protein
VELYWDGATTGKSFNEWFRKRREYLRNACFAGDWVTVTASVVDENGSANAVCVGDRDWRTLLHVFVETGAPAKYVYRLIELGALRSIRDRRALRPVDLLGTAADEELEVALEPSFKHSVPAEALEQLQVQLHRLIHERADSLIEEHQLRLPQLSALLEIEEPTMWCPIPGMYGGFRVTLMRGGDDPLLETSSVCRVAGGSGQRHEITPEGYLLVEAGYD